jgi:hypothetical protein
MFKALDKKVRALCTPAMIYLVISVVAVGLMMIQNVNAPKDKYCVGSYECQLSEESYKIGFFLGKVVYLIFWTWVLNMMCDAGYKDIAWFFVILPIVGMFVFIAALMTMVGAHLKK